MIAADTSSLVAYLQGLVGADVTLLDHAVDAGLLVLPPVVVTEILSGAQSAEALHITLSKIEVLQVLEGYWYRAGDMRCALKAHGLKAKTADALIAQSCIDHDVALVTRDADFRHFQKHCGLKLA